MTWAFEVLGRLFSSDGFVPRRICGLWPDWLVWEHVSGNALIWLAYIALPVMIFRLGVRRSEAAPFMGVIRALALFIGMCGLGHFLDMLAFFHPMYRLSGHILLITGLISWWTAWSLYRAWPGLMALKSPAELERIIDERTAELRKAIIERERAEAARAYLATIVESSLDAIVSKDLNGIVTTWNPAAERLFGYTAAEAVGRPITLVVPDDRLDEEAAIIARQKDGEPISQLESVRITKDGRLISVSLSISPIRDSSGRIVGISKIARDITERKLAEIALRDSERQFRALVEALPQMVWSTRPDGVAEYASPQWMAFTGFGDYHEIGRHWSEIIHPDDQPRVDAAWTAARAKGETYDIEFRMRRHDGAYRWFRVRGVAVLEPDGEVARWFGVCTDIDDERTQTEALRKSEERQRLALSAARISHWEWYALDDRITYQDSLSTMYDRPDDRPFANLGEYLSIVHPDDRAAVRAAAEHALTPGVPYEVEYRIIWNDGSIRWLSGRGGTYFGEDGRPIRMVGVNLDITERKESELQIRLLNETLENRVQERTAELATASESLREAALRFRAIFDSMLQFIGMITPEGIVVEANQTALDFAGITRDDVVGVPAWETRWFSLSTQTQERLRQAVSDAANGEIVRYELDVLGAGDRVETIDFSIKPMHDESGRVVMLIPEGHVITERRRAVEALKRSEAALRESQRLAGVGSWEWDPVNDIVTWSDELHRIAGHDPSLPAPAYADQNTLFTPESLARLDTAITAVLESGQGYEIELEMVRENGSNRWVIARGEAVKDADGRVIALRGTLLDVTMRKRFEEELRRARDTAMAATQAKSEFLANMSHEIRTPMNGVLGMTELLLDTPLNDLQRGYAETIQSGGEALLTVINDILDFSKIEAGKLTLESSEFDLATLMEEVADLLIPRARQKELEIVCRIAPEVPGWLVGDPVRIRQILTNLAGNAVKFTDHGQVSLEARVLHQSDETVTLRILVRDTGMGIAPERQHDIFDSFTQIEGANNRRYGGTGLGLAICLRLVDLMGGRIGLESRVGEGSTFWFELELGRAAHDGQALSSKLSGLRVLIVSHNPNSRDAISDALLSWTCHPEIAASASDGLSRLSAITDEPSFGLIMIDQDLPGTDAESAARAIKALPDHSDTPLALITPRFAASSSNSENPVWTARVTTPIRRSHLYDAVHRAIDPASPLGSVVIDDGTPVPRPCRVLLAEDNEVNRMVAIGMLERLGHTVEAVWNGREVISALDHRQHDIVLMDVQMPDMDGFTATAKIRELERGTARRIPIIAMTAHAMRGDRERCLEAGMDGYISKPVRSSALREALMSCSGNVAMAAHTEPEVSPAVFDAFSVEILETCCGHDPLLIREVLQLMLNELPGRLDRLGAASASRSGRELAWEAHDLKGLFMTIGAADLAATCQEIMSLGDQGQFDSIDALYRPMRRQWSLLVPQAQRYLDTIPLEEAAPTL